MNTLKQYRSLLTQYFPFLMGRSDRTRGVALQQYRAILRGACAGGRPYEQTQGTMIECIDGKRMGFCRAEALVISA